MKVCIYGAGSKKLDEKYLNIGYNLGKALAENNHEIIIGAGKDGMMGAVSEGIHDNSGTITGISPEWMENFEDIYPNCNNLIYTKTMDERKRLFLEKSDAFIVTPGGIGTLDEFFEVITLKKVERHNKTIILFNIDHYYDTMLEMINFMIKEKTITPDSLDLFTVATSVDDCLKQLKEKA